jgi:hypothetical protein
MGGFPVQVNEAIEGDVKERYGPLAFWVGGAKAAADLTRWRLTVDGEEFADVVAAGVGNGRTAGGGIEVWPEADPGDGVLDLCVLPAAGVGAAPPAAARTETSTVSRPDVLVVSRFAPSRRSNSTATESSSIWSARLPSSSSTVSGCECRALSPLTRPHSDELFDVLRCFGHLVGIGVLKVLAGLGDEIDVVFDLIGSRIGDLVQPVLELLGAELELLVLSLLLEIDGEIAELLRVVGAACEQQCYYTESGEPDSPDSHRGLL